MRTSRQSIFVAVAALPLFFVTACGDDGGGGGADCGSGTSLEDGFCVPDQVPGGVVCGENTVEQDGECVLVTDLCGSGQVYVDGECRDEVVCAPGTTNEDGECVAEACPDGQIRDEEGTCRDEQGCGMGTVDLNGECVPEDDLCSDGEVWIGGMCRPERGCGPGTLEVDGTCEVIDPLDLADVLEGPENNDFFLGGTPTPFAVSDTLDDPIYLSGVIDVPQDFNDDDIVEGDIDSWVFSGVAGDRLRIEGTAVGIPSVGFFLTYLDDLSQGYQRIAIPLGTRNAAREVVLPFTGEYELGVGDAYEIFIEFLPVGEPDGAADYTYLIAVTPIASPDFIEDITGTFTFNGDLLDLDQHHVDLPAGELVELTLETDNLDAVGAYWPSTVDHLEVDFGDFVGGLHPVPDGGLLINTDFVYTLARDTGYTLDAVRRPVTEVDPEDSDIHLADETIDSGGERFYRFNTNGDIVLTAQATATDGGDVVVLVYDADLVALGASQNPDDFSIPDDRSVTLALASGTYYVQIVEDIFDDVPDDESTFLFDLDVTSVPLPALGDGLISAGSPTISAADLTGLDTADNEIFLRFDAGDYGEAALTADPAADLDVELNFFERRLLAVGGQFLPAVQADTNGADGDESLTRLVPPTQMYVRLVAVATGSANTVSVDVGFSVPQNLIVETEDNDTPSEVDPLGAVTATTLGAAMFQVEKGGEDIDFWSFELTSPAIVDLETVQLGGEPVDTFMVLYDSSLALIDLNDDIDFDVDNFYSRLDGLLLDAGSYFVEIDQLDIVGVDEATDHDFYLLDVTIAEELACFPGAAVCVGDEVEVCSEDGTSATQLACASGVCDDVAGDCQANTETDDVANGDPTTAQTVAVATDGRALVDGALDAAGDSDFYAFTLGAESIVTTFLETIGDSPADAVLHLYAVPGGGAAALDDGAFPGCNTVATPDDCIGFDDTFLRPQIGPTALPAGDYLVRVSGFSGVELGTYRLVIQVESSQCSAGEQECADDTLLDYCGGGIFRQTSCLVGCETGDPDTCGAITVDGASVAGVDLAVGPNSYSFAASAGDFLDIAVDPSEAFDSRFFLCDLGDADCTFSGINLGDSLQGADPGVGAVDTLTWEVPADGVYTLTVEGWSGTTGTYDIDIQLALACTPDDNGCEAGTASLCVSPDLLEFTCLEGCDVGFCGPLSDVFADTGLGPINADNLQDFYGFAADADETLRFDVLPDGWDSRFFICPVAGENPEDPPPACAFFGTNLGDTFDEGATDGDGSELDSLTVTFAEAGDYYLVVEDWSGEGTYDLTVTPGDLVPNPPGPETAVNLGPIDDDRFIIFSNLDDLGPVRDADWFAFSVSAESLVRIETFEVAGSDVDDTEIWLYPDPVNDENYPGCGGDSDNCAANDDDAGADLMSLINQVFPAGDYLLRVGYTEVLGQPYDIGPYRLEIETFATICAPDSIACTEDGDVSVCDDTGFDETVFDCSLDDCADLALGSGCAGTPEGADNDTFGTAVDLGELPVGRTVVTGSIDVDTDQDWFVFSVAGPSAVNIQTAQSLLVDPADDVDTEIDLFESDGSTLIENDDDDGDGLYSLVSQPLDGGTTYALLVRVSDLGGGDGLTGDYRLTFDVESLTCFPNAASCVDDDVEICDSVGGGIGSNVDCAEDDCTDQVFGSDCTGTEDPEDGDTPGDAPALTLDEGRTVVRGDIQEGDEDWFFITLASPSNIHIETAARIDLDPVVTADTFLELFEDDASTLIDDDDDGGFGNYDLIEATLNAGDYYIRVTEFSAGDYRLIIDVGPPLACIPGQTVCEDGFSVALCDAAGETTSPLYTCAAENCTDQALGGDCLLLTETEDNDDFGSAEALGTLNEGRSTVNGSITPGDDSDWFTFVLDGNSDVVLETWPSLAFYTIDTVDTQMNLYESDGSTLIEFDDDDATTSLYSLIERNLDAGTYVVEVLSFSDRTGDYQLVIDVAGAPAPILVISEIVDGDLSGGLPKFVEITNIGDAPADLSEYSLGNYNNGTSVLGGDASTVLSGTLNPCESHVTSWENGDSPGTSTFFTVYGFDADDLSFSATINGDDVVALFRGPATGDGSDAELVDVYGVIGVNGDDEPWDYSDGYASRLDSVTDANATFVEAEWNFGGALSLEADTDPERTALLLANTTPGATSFCPDP